MSVKKRYSSLDPEDWESAEELEAEERTRRKLYKENKRINKKRLDEDTKPRKRGKDDSKD